MSSVIDSETNEDRISVSSLLADNGSSNDYVPSESEPSGKVLFFFLVIFNTKLML